MRHDDVAILQTIEGALQQQRVGVGLGGQFITQETRCRPADMAVATGLRGGQRVRRRATAGSAPEGIEPTAGQLLEARIRALQLCADGARVHAFAAAIRQPVADLVADVLTETAVSPGVAAKSVAFRDARLPVRRPAGVERMVPAKGLFLGEKEGRLDAMPRQRLGDQVGVAHVAGVKGQVERPLAGSRGRRGRRGECGRASGQQAQAKPQVADQGVHLRPA
jgi:hypothetical protein